MNKRFIPSAALSVIFILTGCGGGSDSTTTAPNSNTPSTPSTPSTPNTPNVTDLKISGQVAGKPAFNIPCDDLNSSLLVAAAEKNINYAEIQFESASTGVVFRIILPTKISLYSNSLGRYKVLGPEYVDAIDANKFLLNVKVPYGDLTGDRFFSNTSHTTTPYYTELVQVAEQSKTNETVKVLLKFKFNHDMIHYKNGILQSNSELNNGELNILVDVANL